MKYMDCRRLRVEDKVTLEDLVVRNSDLLGEEMRILAQRLGTRRHGYLDLLGVDGNRRLVVIDLALVEDNRLWIESLSHLQWADENRDNIRKMFLTHHIDASLPPRVILIAPGFSPELKAEVAYFAYTRVDLFAFQYLEVNGERGFLLDTVDLPVEQVRREESQLSIPQEVTLTEEEMAEFLHFEDDLRSLISSESD